MKKSRKKSIDAEPPSEVDLAEAFEEEIKKPYYDVFYLDNFKLPYDKLDVSIVIPTYNRCPYKPDSLKRELNPLAWALQSLMFQKPKISEIIVVDDNSTDYTEDVVKIFKGEAKEKGIKLKYIKNEGQKGNAIARHIGCEASNSKYLIFMDDDCIVPPYASFGAVYTFEKLEGMGRKVGMVNLPTYFRRSKPSKFVSKKDIGAISFLKGTYTTNKGAFPEEYLNGKEDKKFLDIEYHILEPFTISNMNSGFTLCSNKCYQEIGGFKSNVIGRGIDREFGCSVIENGYLIYFSPDPKFQSIHGAYGLNSEQEFEGEDWFKKMNGMISLKKAMSMCNNSNGNNGMRISSNDYFYHAILSFFVLVYPRNKKGAMRWIEKVHTEFVKNGNSKVFGNIDIKAPGESERKEMWEKAITEGIKFIKNREMKDIKKISKVLNKIKKEKTISSEIINLISETE